MVKARSSFAWSNRADIAPPLAPDRGHHCLYPKDVERPSQIVDERREAELGAHIIDASHQEGALIHPLLDAAEGMLDDLAAAVENVGPRRQALRHAIERGLVFDAGDRADAVRASCAQRAVAAGFGLP